MKFFSAYEIFNSIVFSLLSGILFGGIYSASESILIFLKEILLLFPKAVGILPLLSFRTLRDSVRGDKGIRLSGLERNIFEAVMFSFFGIAMILLSYIALDGYIRMYIFFVSAMFFFLSHKYVGKKFSLVCDFIFGTIYFITILIISITLFPFYKAGLKLRPLVKRVFSPIVKAMRKKRSYRLLKTKLKEINDIMKIKV